MWSIFYLCIVFSLGSCDEKSNESDSALFQSPKTLAELTDERLQEPSGIAASANNPGLLWTHNDSGNQPEIFLIDQKLKIKLTCKLKGISNRDWEDITVGPGPIKGKSYVYVGEIGDNYGMFTHKNIYRFEEPVLKEGTTAITISSFETITFRLPDARKDTETLMINPTTKDLYVVSKREQPVWIYELKYPQSTKDTVTATKLLSLPYSQIVGGDFSADGKEILLKNYQHIFYWKIEDGDIKKSLGVQAVLTPYTEEPQGEAITFSRDGSGFFTLSEKVKSFKSYLYFYPRE